MYARDPWGDRTVAVLLSHLITLMLNVHRDEKKHPLPFSADEVLPPIVPPLVKPVRPVVVNSQAESFMSALRM